MLKAYVVIPNWNGKELLPACLAALAKQTRQAEGIIVVDNGSVDGSVEMLKEKYADIELVELPVNRGFAGGVNAGINRALEHKADYVVLLNNDAAPDKDWLSELTKAADDHKEAGIITSKLLLEKAQPQRIDSTGDYFSHWGLVFPRGRDEIDKGQYDNPEEVFGASGGASLYRTKMLEEIGQFDEDFFAYFEDVDISFRAQLAGWKVRYQPTAIVYHGLSKTSSRHPGFSRYHTIKNYVFLYYKNMPGWLFWRYILNFKLAYLLVLLRSLGRGYFGSTLKGLGMVIIKMPAILAKRWRIQKNRKVSVDYINSIIYHELPPLQRKKLGLRNRT